MSRVVINNKAEKGRFVLVGLVNTAIDFGIFLLLGSSGMSPVAANYISTSTAFSFSFFANKKYTFKDRTSDLRRQIVLFLVFTLFGLWVLQPLVIRVCADILHPLNLQHTFLLTILKLLATVVSLSWNYITYSRYVFKSVEKTVLNIKE